MITSLLMERCQTIRSSLLQNEGKNQKLLRIRTPNYDSLAYSILYATNQEFRRHGVNKRLAVSDLLRQMDSVKSPLMEDSIDDLTKHFQIEIVVMEWNNTKYDIKRRGSNNTRTVYILKTERYHYEPIAFYNYTNNSYSFIYE